MKTKDKKLILLKFLYQKRFDGKYHDVEAIISSLEETNKIELNRLAKLLADEGLIKIVPSKSATHAEITSAGVEYLENLGDEIYSPYDLFDPDERETIKTKLDEFSERLKRIELGQQIIYDDLTEEIETLKKLLNILGKKDWGQMLKGKLVDAGFGSISDQVFNLLIDIFKNDKLLNG